jgi:hypothetical protein
MFEWDQCNVERQNILLKYLHDNLQNKTFGGSGSRMFPGSTLECYGRTFFFLMDGRWQSWKTGFYNGNAKSLSYGDVNGIVTIDIMDVLHYLL